MCCFSRPVTSVTQTRIFARPAAASRQILVYGMQVDAPEELAMILPLPVGRGAREDALEFVSLEKYPQFFDDLEAGFPQPAAALFGIPDRAALSVQKLAVVQVGSFDASFVPRIADFERLDARFRLPGDVWEKLGTYSSYGFAVFQLKTGRARIHPMAFTFPNWLSQQLYFPTVHIHDGKVHPFADFDHVLYAQATRLGREGIVDWQESDAPAKRFVNLERARALVLGERHVYRRVMSGRRKNEDVRLAVA